MYEKYVGNCNIVVDGVVMERQVSIHSRMWYGTGYVVHC
jgi:hypothetical protein